MMPPTADGHVVRGRISMRVWIACAASILLGVETDRVGSQS